MDRIMKRTSKKIIFWSSVLLIVLISVGLLLSNRARYKAKARQNVILTTFPVTVEQVKYENLDITLEYSGTVFPNADVNIASESPGKVVAVNADLGDYVAKGKILVQLDNELKIANLQTAEANYEKAKKDLERYEQLFKEKSATAAQLDQARFAYETAEAQYKIAKKQLEDTRIKAPFSGFISARNVEIGSVISTGAMLFNLIDLSTVRVKIQVPEKDIFKIRRGDKVKLSTDALVGEIFTGTIENVGNKADEAKTYPVEIFVKNPKNLLKAGMFVRVQIPSAIKGKSLLISRQSLVGSIRNPQVYVVENNIARLRNIQIGSEVGKKLEVISGLKEGELVITNGIINLKDNTKVTIVQ
jgi:RND family efflux transporter MFP subunit